MCDVVAGERWKFTPLDVDFAPHWYRDAEVVGARVEITRERYVELCELSDTDARQHSIPWPRERVVDVQELSDYLFARGMDEQAEALKHGMPVKIDRTIGLCADWGHVCELNTIYGSLRSYAVRATGVCVLGTLYAAHGEFLGNTRVSGNMCADGTKFCGWVLVGGECSTRGCTFGAWLSAEHLVSHGTLSVTQHVCADIIEVVEGVLFTGGSITAKKLIQCDKWIVCGSTVSAKGYIIAERIYAGMKGRAKGGDVFAQPRPESIVCGTYGGTMGDVRKKGVHADTEEG